MQDGETITLSGKLLETMSTWRDIVSTKLFLLERRSSSREGGRETEKMLTDVEMLLNPLASLRRTQKASASGVEGPTSTEP